MEKLFLILGIVLWASQTMAATYYIDPTCSSSGDGTTTICGAHGPFKTWAEVSWAAGNTYSQKGGTTAYEQIKVGASGKTGQVITMNSYGTGKASLNGGITIAPESWAGPDANGVYSIKGFGYAMLEDGIFLKWKSSPSSLTPGTYYYVWGSGSLNYYKPTSGTPSDHVVEKMRSAAIDLGANSYITIKNFNITKYTKAITSGSLSAGTTINHITIIDNSIHDVEFGVRLGLNATNSQTNTVSHNSFDYVFSGIESYVQSDCGSNGKHDSYEISYNTMTHCSEIRGANGAYNWSQVDTAGWDMEGIGFQNLTNSNIHHNAVTGSCRGIVLFTCAGDESYNNNFHSNYIKTAKESIMFNPKVSDPPAKSFYNNNIYNSILIGGAGGYATTLYAGNVPNPVSVYNNIYNNTIIPSTNGILFPLKADYYDVKNNIISDGKNYLIAQIGSAPAHIIYDYNLYHSGVAWSCWFINNKCLNWTQWKALGANYDPNSRAPAAPLFSNAVGGDYTLTNLSPAKWAGVNVGLIADYAGKPVHNPPSIGAYEYLVYPGPPIQLRLDTESGSN